MSRKGSETRERILDAAQDLILSRGFAGMSVDALIESLDVTKGAFFHHFKSKQELAVRLIERYAREDLDFFEESLARAEKLTGDPLQQVLILVGLYEETFGALAEPYPGCLMASYIYEAQLFEEGVKELIGEVMLNWRKEIVARLEAVQERYPPREPVDLASLADQFLVLIEGAFIVAKSLNDPQIVASQLQHYRRYLELLFNPECATA